MKIFIFYFVIFGPVVILASELYFTNPTNGKRSYGEELFRDVEISYPFSLKLQFVVSSYNGLLFYGFDRQGNFLDIRLVTNSDRPFLSFNYRKSTQLWIINSLCVCQRNCYSESLSLSVIFNENSINVSCNYHQNRVLNMGTFTLKEKQIISKLDSLLRKQAVFYIWNVPPSISWIDPPTNDQLIGCLLSANFNNRTIKFNKFEGPDVKVGCPRTCNGRTRTLIETECVESYLSPSYQCHHKPPSTDYTQILQDAKCSNIFFILFIVMLVINIGLIIIILVYWFKFRRPNNNNEIQPPNNDNEMQPVGGNSQNTNVNNPQLDDPSSTEEARLLQEDNATERDHPPIWQPTTSNSKPPKSILNVYEDPIASSLTGEEDPQHYGNGAPESMKSMYYSIPQDDETPDPIDSDPSSPYYNSIPINKNVTFKSIEKESKTTAQAPTDGGLESHNTTPSKPSPSRDSSSSGRTTASHKVDENDKNINTTLPNETNLPTELQDTKLVIRARPFFDRDNDAVVITMEFKESSNYCDLINKITPLLPKKIQEREKIFLLNTSYVLYNDSNITLEPFFDDFDILYIISEEFTPIKDVSIINEGQDSKIQKYHRNQKVVKYYFDILKNSKEESIQRLFQELEILHLCLKHKYIVQYDKFCHITDRSLIISMEFLQGDNLTKLIENESKLSNDKINLYLEHIIDAIKYLHSKRIIHMDIHSDNVVLNKQLNVAKLIDFDLSVKLTFNNKYCTSIIKKAPKYKEKIPELNKSEIRYNEKVDILCLGYLVAYMVSGNEITLEHTKEGFIDVSSKIKSEISDTKSVPENILKFCIMCTNSNPEYRPTITQLQEVYDKTFRPSVN